MEVAKRLVDRLLGGFLVLLMGASVVNVLWQVFTRFVLNTPSSSTEEIARFLLIWIGVLGAGYGVGQRDHLALELLPENIDGRAYEWTQVAIQVCVVLFALSVLVVGGVRLALLQLSLGQTSAVLGLPIGYIYLVLPLSGATMMFYATVHLAGHLRALRTGTPQPDPAPAEPAPENDLTEGGGL